MVWFNILNSVDSSDQHKNLIWLVVYCCLGWCSLQFDCSYPAVWSGRLFAQWTRERRATQFAISNARYLSEFILYYYFIIFKKKLFLFYYSIPTKATTIPVSRLSTATNVSWTVLSWFAIWAIQLLKLFKRIL